MEHELDNPYDKHAVRALTAKGAIVGYIERDHFVQRVVALEGRPVSARVEKIIGGERGKKTMGVILKVRTGADVEDQRAEIAEEKRRSGCMMTLAFVLPVLVTLGGALAACDSKPRVSMIDAQETRAKDAVRGRLRDPYSAEFRNIYRAGDTVCGQVNARNGFGGMAGYAPFIVAPGDVHIGEPGDGDMAATQGRIDILRSCTAAIEAASTKG